MKTLARVLLFLYVTFVVVAGVVVFLDPVGKGYDGLVGAASAVAAGFPWSLGLMLLLTEARPFIGVDVDGAAAVWTYWACALINVRLLTYWAFPAEVTPNKSLERTRGE